MTAYNEVSKEEAEDLRFFLDDADMLFSDGGGRGDRMLKLWRRLHLWLLSEQGDRDAKMLLLQEFPSLPGELKGPGSEEDERKALLQLLSMFGRYPQATGLSHLVGLLIRDAVTPKLPEVAFTFSTPTFLGGCNCVFKAPTVPTCRDQMQHLDDCPAKNSGFPVGAITVPGGAIAVAPIQPRR